MGVELNRTKVGAAVAGVGVSRHVRGFSLAVLALTLAPGCDTKPDVDFTDQPGAYTLELEPVTMFGNIDDPVLMQSRLSTPHIASDGAGRFYARSIGQRQVVVFDSAGRFVDVLGSPGQGPGEFSGSVFDIMIHPADSVFVQAGWVVSVFSPSLEFVRKIYPPNISRGLVLHDSRIVGRTSNREKPFALTSATGELIHRFGADPDRPSTRHIYLARGEDAIWISTSGQREVERWSLDGVRTHVLDAGAGRVRLWRESPPGVLWILRTVSVENPTLPPEYENLTSSQIRERGLITSNYDHWMRNTEVFLLDVETGRVIASQEFDLDLHPISDRDLLFSQHEDEWGVLSIKVWRVRAVEVQR